jgi:hypothetical protein
MAPPLLLGVSRRRDLELLPTRSDTLLRTLKMGALDP